jgi:uncharacterized protein (TIGR02996 family)
MSLDESFLQSIAQTPEDDTPRLVYADWLAEQNDPRADYLRLELELFTLARAEPIPPNRAVRANRRRLQSALREARQTLLRPWLRRVDRPDWVSLVGYTPKEIAGIVSGLFDHKIKQPTEHIVRVWDMGKGQCGLTFDPPVSADSFAWIVEMCRPSCRRRRRAFGWLTSPGSGTRYCLTESNEGVPSCGLHGLSTAGDRVEYFPLDQFLRRANGNIKAIPEPLFPAGRQPLVLEFRYIDEAANWFDPDFTEYDGPTYANEFEDFDWRHFVDVVSWRSAGHDWLEAQTARRECVMLVGFGEGHDRSAYVCARIGFDGTWHTLAGQAGDDLVRFEVIRHTGTFARIEVPRRLTASEEQAGQAVEAFCKRRELAPGLTWEPGRHPDIAKAFKEACDGE